MIIYNLRLLRSVNCQTPLQKRIRALLHSLGIDVRYIGFYYLAYALELTVCEPERLCMVTKWLYPDVARQFGTDWQLVERAMRYAITVCWQNDPDGLNRITNRTLLKRPSNSGLLTILTDYLLEEKAA